MLDNKHVIKLLEFLNKHAVKGDVECTHTAFGPPWGKFFIGDDAFQNFTNLYKKALMEYIHEGVEPTLHIIERPKRVGPFVIDLDFRQKSSDRVYLTEHIEEMVFRFTEKINKYVKLSPQQIEAFIFEKEQPSYDEKQENYKDGIHIIYPHVVIDAALRYLILEEVRDEVENDNALGDIELLNSYSDIFDISVIYRNGWFMYGSKKDKGHVYELTHIYNNECEDIDHTTYTPDKLVGLLSLRQYTEYKLPMNTEYLTPEFTSILNAKFDKFHGKKKKLIKLNNKDDENRVALSVSNVNNDKKNDKNKQENKQENQNNGRNNSALAVVLARDIEMARKLIPLLSKKRAADYKTWICVGWALYNIDINLLDIFIEFSKKVPEKYVAGCCEEVWEKAKEPTCEKGFSISSIYWWAKEDNQAGYAKVLRESISQYIDKAKSGSHDDIAKLAFELYKHVYRCASISKNQWYEFQDKWILIDKGYTLANRLSDELTVEFSRMASVYFAEIGNKEGEERDKCMQSGKDILKIVEKLKNTSFINSVMEACCRRFHDSKFEEKLDENPFLIGFENGVYDLKNACFRKGTPDDYITMSLGYDYQDYKNSKEMKEIDDYFEKVMRDKDMRDYILTLLSSYLDGRCKDQKFIIWTGSGCHVKGTKIMMYNGSLKNVEDIKLNDKLMGDDSRPRRVKTLFTGEQDMYKLTLDDGRDFVVNKNHRIAIKNSYRSVIEIEEGIIGNKLYRVRFHTKTENMPMEDSMTFTDYNEANKFLNEIQDKLVINGNQIIKFDDVVDLHMYNYDLFKSMKNSVAIHYRMFSSELKFKESSDNTNIDNFTNWENMESSSIITASIDVRKYIMNDFIKKYGRYDHLNNMIVKADKLTEIMCDVIRSLGLKINKTENEECTVHYRSFDTTSYDRLDYSFKATKIERDMFYGFELDGNKRYVMGNYIVTANSNGKSTTVDLMRYTLGDYFGVLPTTVITKKRTGSSNATPELADKRGKRFLCIQEPEHDDVIYVGNMKNLTGCDWIEARALYGMPFMYKPQFKLLLTCNKLPHIPSHDGGTWRRLRVSPWETEFVDFVPNNPKQFPKDRDLCDKLKGWGPSFMYKLLNDYYQIYNKQGLKEPTKVTQYTDKYKKDTDTYYEYLKEVFNLTKNDVDEESLTSVYGSFKTWYMEAYSTKAPPRKDFVNYLTDAGYKVNEGIIKGLKYKG